jgi:hypothetical protein
MLLEEVACHPLQTRRLSWSKSVGFTGRVVQIHVENGRRTEQK